MKSPFFDGIYRLNAFIGESYSGISNKVKLSRLKAVKIPFAKIASLFILTDYIIGALSVCRCYDEDLSVITYTRSDNMKICICDGSFNQSGPSVKGDLEFQKLILKNFKIETLNPENFMVLKESAVVDITITNFFELKYINGSLFNNFVKLKSLFISNAPKLNSVFLDILQSGRRNNLSHLSITKSGLEHAPFIQMENQLFNLIDFEGNSIHTIKTNNIATKSSQLIFNYNTIVRIEKWAFNNSQISEIRLRGNRNLETLIENAFYGLKSLTLLDLSETSIVSIPALQLPELEILIMEETYTLKTIPTIYDFPNLTRAELTFSFHCCAFRLPELHDPEKYAKQESLRLSYCNSSNAEGTFTRIVNESDEEWHDTDVAQPILGQALSLHCKNYNLKRRMFVCSPSPNAFTPCEDIMGHTCLRICVWFIGVISLFGNVCVLAVLLSKQSELSVPNFLITNLAFSDLCMACFLLMLATQDYVSKGYYFNYAFDWQMGIGCKIAGFLSVFSSQLSIFFLTLLTIERWFSIKKALYLNKLTFRRTVYMAFFGWFYAVIMATLPLLGVSNYSTTSLCLPMETERIHDAVYVLLLLCVASIAFSTICVCYYQIYFSLNYETRHKDGEHVLARKMIILVGTNFLCWAPITFFATTAALGFPLINITRSKILLVFFYPLNSCTNPFFYAILTTNFKKDFTSLLVKIGMCKKTVNNYRTVYQAEDSRKIIMQRTTTSQTTM